MFRENILTHRHIDVLFLSHIIHSSHKQPWFRLVSNPSLTDRLSGRAVQLSLSSGETVKERTASGLTRHVSMQHLVSEISTNNVVMVVVVMVVVIVVVVVLVMVVVVVWRKKKLDVKIDLITGPPTSCWPGAISHL